MDLFGIKEHDERHDEMERQLRRLIEQVAQLTIDLGVTRTQMRSLQLQVDGKVAEGDLDPSVIALNQGIKDARVKLAEAEAAADEQWADLLDGLSASIDTVREQTTAAEG
jgi:hypothetical protein